MSSKPDLDKSSPTSSSLPAVDLGDGRVSSRSSEPGIQLSDMTVTPLELGKIQRELFALDQFLKAGKGGKANIRTLPFMSSALKSIVKDQEINLLLEEDRAQLRKQLEFVRRTAPTVQMSFASDPSKQALRVLARWFRENGHPNTLIIVGVQPNIAGGCVVRTAHKTFDFSLQQLFQASRSDLARKFA